MLLNEVFEGDSVTCYFDSSNVLACKYDVSKKLLAVIFAKGWQYVYIDVLPYHFQRFKVSKSQGNGLKEHIINNYVSSKVETKISDESLKQIKETIKQLLLQK